MIPVGAPVWLTTIKFCMKWYNIPDVFGKIRQALAGEEIKDFPFLFELMRSFDFIIIVSRPIQRKKGAGPMISRNFVSEATHGRPFSTTMELVDDLRVF